MSLLVTVSLLQISLQVSSCWLFLGWRPFLKSISFLAACSLITDKGQMVQTFTNKCRETVPALKRASSALGPVKVMVSGLPVCSLLPLVCSQECQTFGVGAGVVIATASALHHALIFSSKGHPWVEFWSGMVLNRPAKLRGML